MSKEPSFDPNNAIPSVFLPEKDYMGNQDVNDPVWPSGPLQPPVEGHPMEVRTNGGGLDLLQHVVEDVENYVEHMADGAGHKRKSEQKMRVVAVVSLPSTDWRAITYNVDREFKLVENRDDRTRVIITNYGPGVLYLSHDSVAIGVAQPNQLQVPVNGFRELRTTREIWATPAVAGTPQVVDVQDEYGLPDWV